MNNLNEIVVSFEKEKNNNEIQPTHSEENSYKDTINDESQLNYLLFRFYENLEKGAYKKTIKEIDSLLKEQNIDELNKSWIVYILRIRAQLKVIKKKIDKYLIFTKNEKLKNKYKINGIKKYLNQVFENLNIFVTKFSILKKDEMLKKVDYLLGCYFEYIYLYCLFNKKLGNIILTISYLSSMLNLYNKTRLIYKSGKTLFNLEKCFILLCQMLISNKDFISSINYIDITIQICLHNLLYNVEDISDGVFIDYKKREINIENNKDDILITQKEQEIAIEKSYGNKNIKRVVSHLIILFYYRGICYENMGKINLAIKAYYQCLWFINNFFYHSSEKILPLFQNTLDKSLELKRIIDYVIKRIKFYDRIQFFLKRQLERKKQEEEKKNLMYSDLLDPIKFQKLENKLLNMNIKEVDTTNPFFVKKNIEDINGKKREGIYKNIFMSDIRLINSYLREDFRPIIDKMEKIKMLDIDILEREKIQKFLRGIYFNENVKKINQKKHNKFLKRNYTTINSKNKYCKSSLVFQDKSKIRLNNKNNTMICTSSRIKNNLTKRNITSAKTNRLTQILPYNKNYSQIFFSNTTKNKKRSKSSITEQKLVQSETSEKKRDFTPITSKRNCYNYKSYSIMNQNKDKKSKYTKHDLYELKKSYKKIRTQSAILYKRIPNEDKDLNQFFDKKYLRKRRYIKLLEDRDLKFQKCILKIKKSQNPKTQLIVKGVMKQKAEELFNRVIGLHLTSPSSFSQIRFLDKKSKQKEKLQNAIINSLDNSPIIKYHIQKNEERNKNRPMTEQMNSELKNVNVINNNIIKDIDNKIEEIKQREYIENKNYQDTMNKNIKYLKLKFDEDRIKSQNISPRYKYNKLFHYEKKSKEHYFYESNNK